MLEDVLKLYGLNSLTEPICISNGTANKNYLIDTNIGRYVLRHRNKKYSNDIQINFENGYLENAASHNIPVPLPIDNIYGFISSIIDGEVYQLYSFIGGVRFNPNNIDEISNAGSFLAKLHNAFWYYIPKILYKTERYDEPVKMLKMLDSILNDNRYWKNKNEKNIVFRMIDEINKINNSTTDDVFFRLPRLVIHGDYHPENVKYNDSRICGIFDFDRIIMHPRIRDVADGIIYFSGLREGTIDGSDIYELTQNFIIDEKRRDAFLGSYNQVCTKKLDDSEIEHLSSFITLRHLNSRIEGTAKVPIDKKINFLTKDMDKYLG